MIYLYQVQLWILDNMTLNTNFKPKMIYVWYYWKVQTSNKWKIYIRIWMSLMKILTLLHFYNYYRGSINDHDGISFLMKLHNSIAINNDRNMLDERNINLYETNHTLLKQIIQKKFTTQFMCKIILISFCQYSKKKFPSIILKQNAYNLWHQSLTYFHNKWFHTK